MLFLQLNNCLHITLYVVRSKTVDAPNSSTQVNFFVV